MKKDSTIIIGAGEIGSALARVLADYKPTVIDSRSVSNDKFEIMHIAFPYSENFEAYVKDYQKRYKPKFTVIHSTVKIGTSKRLKAIHSPVLGIHPHLEEGIKTFTKFLSGKKANLVADYFRRAGLRVYIFEKSETTELMKILDTTFYGICIEYTKDVKKIAEAYKIPFEAWTLWTNNYNEGYTKLNHPEYVRPNLVPIMTDIKGHCVMPNTELLATRFTKFLQDNNSL